MPYKDKRKQIEYQRQWREKRRAKYLNGRVCESCGREVNLELNHTDPDTKESHRIWSWKIERLEAELEKCIVLCKPCHGKAHRTAEHGSRTRYEQHGCRCAVCN